MFLLGVTAFVLLLIQKSAAGEQKPPRNSSPANPKDTSQNVAQSDGTPTIEQIVKVTIATSRPEVTTSGTFGVYADLQNLAEVPITLYPSETTLVVQPEIGRDPDCVIEFDGYFPTEANVPTQLNVDSKLGRPIVIPPKEHYQVFWGLGAPGHNGCSRAPVADGYWAWLGQRGKNFKAYLGFLPGDYAFSVVGKAYLTPKANREDAYHTFVQGTKLHVGITQLQSMLAAMIGGLLAYFVVGLREGGELRNLKREQTGGTRTSLSKWGVIARSVISAALLSSVVTIILSRLSDTQFPIKVSVADFWGALTVGFIAYFTGNKLIDRIVDLGGGPKQTPPATMPPTTMPPTTMPPTTMPPTAMPPVPSTPGAGSLGLAPQGVPSSIPGASLITKSEQTAVPQTAVL